MASDTINMINVMRDFKNFEPELHKHLTKSLNQTLRGVVTTARGLVASDSPMSGWSKANQKGTWADRSYDAEEIRAGFSITRAGGLKHTPEGTEQAYALIEKTPAAVIYDFAGTKDHSYKPDTKWHKARSRPGRPVHKKQTSLAPQGSGFISQIERQSGMMRPKHRLGVRAVIKDRANVIKDLQEVINIETQKFNNRMDARVTL